MNVKKTIALAACVLSTVVGAATYQVVPDAQSTQLKTMKVSTALATNTETVVSAVKNNMTFFKDKVDSMELALAGVSLDIGSFGEEFGTFKTNTNTRLTSLETLSADFANKLMFIDVDYYSTLIGPGAKNPPVNHTSGDVEANAINICQSWAYPSYTYGDFNINLGIDNQVGYTSGTSTNSNGEVYNARYAIGIGTTVKAAKMHSYAVGSQLNAFEGNSSTFGYGLTAAHPRSTVIGHGRRPNGGSSSYDKKFTSWEQADAFLKSASANVFKGIHFEVKTSESTRLYTVTGILSSPDANGYYYEYLETPDTGALGDYEPGQYDWRYGKSHGDGTFNIVAVNTSLKESPGLKAVYINDDSLYDLVMDASGGNTVKKLTLTPSQISKGITFTKDGYDQNSAIEIGEDAVAALDQSYVSSLTSATTLRNVSVAIGARASAVNPSNRATGQAVAIGYCAKACGGQTVAIGPGAVHLDSEDDMTGHNAYASGSTAIAIGYSAKATGAASVALGPGQSGGNSTMASGDNSIAIGKAAQANASGAVQIGTGINTEANTLKFQNVTIVKNGKVSGFDETALDPIEHDITSTATGETTIQAKPHVINSIVSSADLAPGTELGIEPLGSRNYEIFVPNDPETRAGLPMVFESELPDGCKMLLKCDQFQIKFPVTVTIRQPTSKYVIVDAQALDDGYDWTPVVTNCNYVYNTAAGKFMTTDGKKPFEGYNLHCATNIVLEWKNSSNVTQRKSIAAITGNQTHIDVTFFKYADPANADTSVAAADAPVAGSKIGVYYSSRNGTSEKFEFDAIID